MLKINKKTEYALMALRHLAENPVQKSTVREICELYQIPFDTTSKVLQALVNGNIVVSIQGVKGGYSLVSPLREISYLKLVETIEGKSSTIACLDSGKDCKQIPFCNIISPVQKLEGLVSDYLQNLNLEDLLLKSQQTLKEAHS